ncbi:MAG TPA: type II secretion system protein [Verrucomicrobiae bacterium]
MKTVRCSSAFTLIELLVVISILGILTALTVPALKNLGKSNIQTSAARQLLDDVGRAHQLAINQHTTVYMVFVPTNFCNVPFTNGLGTISSATNQYLAFAAATNLMASQLTGYNFLTYGKLGDQPGQHQWHYSDQWQKLPDGNMIAAAKFSPLDNVCRIPLWESQNAGRIENWRAGKFQIYAFTNISVPFPTENSPLVPMPCLIFNYLGHLVSETDGGSFYDAYIPLAQGSVSYGIDPATKSPILTTTPVGTGDITENPPGNSTNISFNVVHIDALTGRATLEFYKLP